MALTYNGVSPTKITFNGTDLTVLKYGNTAVWGKPYSLTITQGVGTLVSVLRTSSPNQNASIGALSNGSLVYYGDVLKISATAQSGYTLNSFTINGESKSGTQTWMVVGEVTVFVSAVGSASWHTVWSGSITLNFSLDAISPSSTSSFNITGLVSSASATRVTGTATAKHSLSSTATTNSFSDKGLTSSDAEVVYDEQGAGGVGVYLSYSSNAIYAKAVLTTTTLGSETGTASATLTKVEQYY